jgi:hypothetical protein
LVVVNIGFWDDFELLTIGVSEKNQLQGAFYITSSLLKISNLKL